jgi:nucleotide-binding universal stress UspA family protein/CBS domain-containing protein
MKETTFPHFMLHAKTAADLMTPNPVTISVEATIAEAAILLTNQGVSVVPVLDATGYPLGVVSRADLVRHGCETAKGLSTDFDGKPERAAGPRSGTVPAGEGPPEPNQRCTVRALMTPFLLSVAPETPAVKVLERMLSRRVHRLFVLDGQGQLVGVISALDLLRHLQLQVRTVLHPTSLSEHSRQAFREACAIAQEQKARLIVLHVRRPCVTASGEVVPEPGSSEQLWKLLQELRAPDAKTLLEYRLAEGEPATEIVRIARETECELIVMGKDGRARLGQLLIGGVTTEVARNAPCWVTIAEEPLGEQAAARAAQTQELVRAE